MSTVLPNRILERMRPEDRKKLGRAGQTAAEGEAAFVAKTEAQLQAQIQAMLQRNGVFVIRQRTDRRSNVAIGCPDMLFSIGGRAIAWEVKMPGKNPRPEQIEAMTAMRTNGWSVAVVRSYAEALGLFNAAITISPLTR